jgi:hypothetical protein
MDMARAKRAEHVLSLGVHQGRPHSRLYEAWYVVQQWYLERWNPTRAYNITSRSWWLRPVAYCSLPAKLYSYHMVEFCDFQPSGVIDHRKMSEFRVLSLPCHYCSLTSDEPSFVPMVANHN